MYKFLSVLMLVCSSVFGASPIVGFSVPEGGQNYYVGSQQLITLVKNNFKTVFIDLSTDGGGTYNKLGSINSLSKDKTLKYSLLWIVPNTNSQNCILRASTIIKGVTIYGYSRVFSIGVQSTVVQGGVGPVGPQGTPGKDGVSPSVADISVNLIADSAFLIKIENDLACNPTFIAAVELALKNDAAFVASCKGNQGSQGVAGPVGASGKNGSNGAVGPQGPPGVSPVIDITVIINNILNNTTFNNYINKCCGH